MPENYASNSNKAKAEPEKKERAPLPKIAEGKVIKRKRSLGSKVKESFTGDDAQSVGDYLIFDVVIPALKATISDVASQGVERMLFGEARPRSTGYSSPVRKNYTNYSTARVAQPNSDIVGGPRREVSQQGRSSHNFDEVIFETRGEAEAVLEMLGNLINEYDVATVADLYEMVNITGEFTDQRWGWYDLQGASVQPSRAGYLLNLARPQPLN